MWFWKKSKTPEQRKSEAEKKLALIESILFPQFSTESTPEGLIFHVDYSIDSNLQTILDDLEEDRNDAATRKVMGVVIKKLMKTREILEAYPLMDKRAEYIIVDTPKDENINYE
jgi:hypothetical protein